MLCLMICLKFWDLTFNRFVKDRWSNKRKLKSLINFKKNKIVKESVNEASNTGERIQNLNNRIKVLRDKISATKSPEQKKLHSDRLKNALQSLSNIKKDHGIKAPHRESVVNEDSETNRLEKLIKNLEETNKLLLQNLNHTKSLPNNKKENIKKSIAVNLDLINYYKKWLKDYQSAANESLVKEDSPCWKGYKQVGMKNKGGRQVPNCVPNESIVKEAGLYGGVPKMYVKYLAVQKKVRELEDAQRAMGAKYFAEKNPKKKEAMMPLLKKGTNQLEMYRRNLADIERKYIDNLYKDVEQSPDFE